MRTRFALLIAIAVCFTFSAARCARAQALAVAELNGTVTDPSGATVANAKITVTDTATNAAHTTTSNASGFYAVTNLPPGTYNLAVTARGFAQYRQTGIVLTVGGTTTADASLQVASQGEKVVVTTEVPLIEPTKTEISQVVQTRQIQSLPISNRVFTDFALLTPGVATSRTSFGTTFTEIQVTQISFGGMRSFSNEVTVDGADFINSGSGIQRATPPQASVQEFRVVNNSFGAEYGRAMGGIVNIVTKSGTNNFHGSLYEYFQNNATDARSLLQPKPLPDQFRENQFGVTMGGPIQKDKTFFFVNYEGRRQAQSPVYPPDLVNNILAIDQSKALMGLAPEGCQLAGGLNACVPNLAGNPNNITQAQATGFLNGFLKIDNDDSGFARVDHQFNANNRLALRYNVEDIRAPGELVGDTLDGGGVGVPSGARNLFVRDQAVVATLNSVVSPNVVNTLLGQFARRHYNYPGATGQPDFSILNDLELGHNFGANDREYETRGELSDTVSWVKGDHIVKFGFDGNYVDTLQNFPGFDPVRMLVPGVSCLANFASFFNTNFGANEPVPGGVSGLSAQCPVPGDNGVVFTYGGVPLPTSGTACIPSASSGGCSPTVTTLNPLNGGGFPNSSWANAYPPQFLNNYSRVIDHGYWGVFFQDQWRITPKLTFNYGIRWDVESGLGALVNTDYNGWQPRIGLAYSPDSKTVLRAGFGIFFDRQNLTFFFVPNTQKIVAGYQCGNHPTAYISSVCSAAGVRPQEFPNIMSNLAQSTQGYQIFGFPAAAGASAVAASVIATGGYDSFTNNGTPTGTIAMAGTCSTTGACGIGEGGMDHNSRTPYAEQASAEIDHQFGGGFALNVGYLFVGGHKLVRGNNINVPCPVGTTDTAQAASPTDPNPWVVPIFPDWVPGLVNANGTFSSCSSGTPTLGTGALAGLGPWFAGAGPVSGLQTMSSGLEDYNNDVSNTIYHGLTVTAIERLGNYFNLTANYTYSHTIDNGNFTTFINLPVNQFDFAAEEANSNQDVRHRLVANFTANTPTHGWFRNFLFSSIITLQSGRPFTIFYGSNTLNDVAGGATDRVGGAGVRGSHCATAATCQTMIPRNTYIGDPEYDWDFRIGRTFHLSDRWSMDLAFDAFNAFNRPNVAEVTSVYGSPVFCGAIPRHYNDSTTMAIQAGASSVACPNGLPGETPVYAFPGGPQVGNNAATPISDPPFIPNTSLFIPNKPNTNFGLPRVMLSPRRLQFSAKFDF